MNTTAPSDHLTITIDPFEESPIGGIYFLVYASVNGELLGDVLDVDEFFKSLTPLQQILATRNKKSRKSRITPTTERLPIFTCTCGFFGCGGCYVAVTVTPTTLLWDSAFQHSGGNNLCHYHFSWPNIRDVAATLIAGITDATTQYLGEAIGSGVMTNNLSERLPFYRQQLDILITAAEPTRTPPYTSTK